MLRTAILAAARSRRIERLVETAPLTRALVRRFVAGTGTEDALRVTRELAAEGMRVSLDFLGEDTATAAHAEATKDEYLHLLKRLADARLGADAEVSLKLSALGLRFDEKLAYEHAHAICAAAAAAGTVVTVDMEEHTTADATLEIVERLRRDFPSTGAVLQACLRRTEADCRELAVAGSRVRLVKGAYKEPESVGYRTAIEVGRSFVRCLNVLLAGPGYPMVATHDPRLIAITEDRGRWLGRATDEFEFQMLYGVRPQEQRRLVAEGYLVRVYLPYGTQWYPYLMRRLAERPANVAFFARAATSRR
ncbi:MAG: proline dehydrogenase family protein [Micromonosporaceae bacterium]|nr:proline dehydrogenase family protein [Micromonosporaceae bacterium]